MDRLLVSPPLTDLLIPAVAQPATGDPLLPVRFLFIGLVATAVATLIVRRVAQRWYRLVAGLLLSLVLWAFTTQWFAQHLPRLWPQLAPFVLALMAFLGGTAAVLLIIWAPLLALALVSANAILNLTTLTGESFWQAARFVFLDLLNINLSYQVVDKGKVAVMKPAGILPAIGKGLLIVHPGHGVITERGGTVRQVLGPGYHNTVMFEQVKHVVDLNPQEDAIEFQKVPTRDGALLSGKVLVTYQIQRLGVTAPRPLAGVEPVALSGVHPVHSYAVARSVYRSNGGHWREQTRNAVLAALTHQIGASELTDIFDDPMGTPGPDSGLILLTANTTARANSMTRRWGVQVLELEFIELPVPETLAEHVVTPWEAGRANILDEQEQQSRQDFIAQQTSVRQELLDDLSNFVQLMDLTGTPHTTQQRTLALLERVLTECLRDRRTAFRYFQILEAISENPNAKLTLVDSKGQSLPLLP